jgi:hypothetical protein
VTRFTGIVAVVNRPVSPRCRIPPGIPEAIAVEVGELVGLATRDGEDSKQNVPIYAGVGEQGFKERPR